MKTILLSVGTALIASGLAIALSYRLGARGEVFRIVMIATVVVSCAVSFTAASIGVWVRRRNAGVM